MARNRASDLAALAGVGLAGYMAAREGRKDKAPVEDRMPPTSYRSMQDDIGATTPRPPTSSRGMHDDIDATTPVDTSNVDVKGIGRASTAAPKIPAQVPTVASKPVGKNIKDEIAGLLARVPAPRGKEDMELALSPTAVKLDQSGKPYRTLAQRGTVEPSRLSRMLSGNPLTKLSGMKRGGAVKRMASGGSVKVTASRRGDGSAQRGKTRGKMC